MTPSDFEVACGMSTSKDWKRSIRCGGFTIQKLVVSFYLFFKFFNYPMTPLSGVSSV